MSKLVLLFLAVTSIVVILPGGEARAHVLIRDKSGQYGAVLHISPADDPVVGERATIFFDFAGSNVDLNNYNFNLEISSPSGQESAEVIYEESSGLRASYIFPRTGVYNLHLRAESKADSQIIELTYDQRISRGSGVVATVRHAWADMLAVGAGVGIVGILIIVINRQREIRDFAENEPSRRG